MAALESFEEMIANIESARIERAIERAKAAGQQKYPVSIIKQSAELYSVDAYSYDDGSSEVSINTWVVRSIKRKRGTQTPMGKRRLGSEYGDSAPTYVNITQKIKDVTWTRQSRKVNDFGWSKSIPEQYRKQFRVGDFLPEGIYTTVNAAIRYAIKAKESSIKRSIEWRDKETDPQEIAEWDADIECERKELRLLKTRQTKLKNAAKKAKSK
ncbi:hypothetical protein K5N55_003876 [Vibrio vulnificus]|nr:hypothetical protein [Vibrio vulnificus]